MRLLLALIPTVALAQTGTIIDDDSAPPGPSDTLTFADVHATVIDSAGFTNQRFGIAACDFNRDGYWDFVIQDHSYPAGVARDIQFYIGDAQLTFNRITSGQPQSDTTDVRRITSSPSCLDVNGDGWSDHYGPDADGADAGVYYNTTTVSGGTVTFQVPRVTGCTGSKNRCWSADIDGDGNLERIEDAPGAGVGTSTWRGRRIVDWVTGVQDYQSVTDHTSSFIPEGSTQSTGGYAIVADFDGNGWSDICYPYPGEGKNGCYWNVNGVLTWQQGTGPVGEMNARQFAVGDYDRDGDLDVMMRNVVNITNTPTWIYVFRNNGDRTFTDVTSASGLPLGNQQGGTQTSLGGVGSYANLFAGDLNLDGCTDVVVPAERTSADLSSNRISIYVSDCDMTFTRESSALDVMNTQVNAIMQTSSKFLVKGVDFDWDGDLDIVSTSGDTQNIGTFRNTTNYANKQYLSVKLKGPQKNTEALGTTLWVWNAARTSRVTTFHTGENQQGQIHPTIGLGSHTVVDIDVQCPPRSGVTGPRAFLDNVGANQRIVIDCSGATPSWSVYNLGSNW